ncbi:MAG: 1-hydroxycarotenoid 3,4-desaturase CrtD, partial [Paracoccaceae bacterium]
EKRPHTVVIGAGFGGLSAAIRLAAAGHAVTVIESANAVGGKARALPSGAGPVDTGPTVLTMRAVFDDLFALAGERLEDHVTLIPQAILARHWWPDGSTLDLTPDRAANIAAITAFAGAREARAFARFDAMAEKLRLAFDAPVMQSAQPDLRAIARAALRKPAIWPALLPGMTLDRLLRLTFRDARLRQLFGRYATYVGGRPTHVPAVLAIIWRAEAQGVWAVQGGMHHLAAELAALLERLGGNIILQTPVRRILKQDGRVTGVETDQGRMAADHVVFNGDPAALSEGLLGNAPRDILPAQATAPRSLSAHVWAFAATPSNLPLVHHNVFFTADPAQEFGPIGKGRAPDAPSLYICAEDRAMGTPDGPDLARTERFEIIINAPAGLPATPQEETQCRIRTFQTLARFGLTFSPEPDPASLLTPAKLATLFPASQGAIYGRSPDGMFATFRRPPAQTTLPGLVLAGGGCHPGAGVPMAALSGKHAAAAILTAPISASKLAPMAMHGGMLTASVTAAPAPSASSALSDPSFHPGTNGQAAATRKTTVA